MPPAQAGPGEGLSVLIEGAAALDIELSAEQIDLYRAYLDLLIAGNQRISLTSPAALADAERVHLLDSLSLIPLLRRFAPGAASLVDVGSGAGFPGLVLKIAEPKLRIALVESVGKKAEFLRDVASRLGLSDVAVVGRRAEEAAHDRALRGAFDVATARALAALPVVMELTMPFLRPGGVLLAQRGADAGADPEAAAAVAAELGGRVESVERPDGGSFAQHAVVVVRQERPAPWRYPRRTGVPAKHPLGGGGAEA